MLHWPLRAAASGSRPTRIFPASPLPYAGSIFRSAPNFQTPRAGLYFLKDAIGIMNVDLEPEDDQLIQKRLRSGSFESAQEVIHRALQAQDAEEAWLELHEKEVREKIDLAIAEFDQGGGIPGSEVRPRLQELLSSASPFRQHTVRGKLVNPDLDLDRTSHLVEREDQAQFKRK